MTVNGATVNVTESAQLLCISVGTPETVIGSGFVVKDGSNERIEIVENDKYSFNETVTITADKNIEKIGILTVSNTTADDAGVYTCIVTNARGSSAASGRLDVQCEFL